MTLFKKATIVLTILFLNTIITGTSKANDDICPDNMTLDQCYSYLTKKIADLDKQSKIVSGNLSAEKYNQLTLNQQIDYTKRKIAEAELEIQKTEIELETKNVEIRMIERDIEETQNNVATVKQESTKLEASISKRLSISYKYSLMNPLELLVKSQDFDTLLRKMKYLIETRKNDKILLSEMQNKSVVLDAEERVLGKSKLDLEKARIEVEEKKTYLFNQKEFLASQQTEHARLLAPSKQRESSYTATLSEIEKMQNEAINQIAAIIRLMYERGQIAVDMPVKRGDIVGAQGYTGYTYGSHLHLVVYNTNGQSVNPFSAGYLTGGNIYGNPVGSANYHYPVDGGILTQSWWFKSSLEKHLAIDVQSHTYGDQSGGKYYGAAISCYGLPTRAPGYYNTRGTGAPVRALADGKISKIQTDACGGKYVIIEHDDGNSSLYLHLQ
jgi:hypothetical protein